MNKVQFIIYYNIQLGYNTRYSATKMSNLNVFCLDGGNCLYT